MNGTLTDLLKQLEQLEQFGTETDERESDRTKKMLNITPDTGAFLALLVQATKAHRILEIGTSNGYSTLWLAEAVKRRGGQVTTVEIQAGKADMALANFASAGLSSGIELIVGDAGEFLTNQKTDSFDFVFLDADRKQYCQWWSDLQNVLMPLGLLVVDNAVSHANEIQSFVETVEGTRGYCTSQVPIGKGEFLVLKKGQTNERASVEP
jgi:predicted O-methyltransferase YrrM